MMSWLDEENARAKHNLDEGLVENPSAPRLVKPKKTAPPRATRGIFVSDKIWNDYADFLHEQKKLGNKAPEINEEALINIMEKYKFERKSKISR